jgi:hypothetical protein
MTAPMKQAARTVYGSIRRDSSMLYVDWHLRLHKTSAVVWILI